LKQLKVYTKINKSEVLAMTKKIIVFVLSILLISMVVMCGVNKEAKRLNNLGIKYYRDGDIERAITELEKALEIAPKFIEAHYNLGNVYSHIDSLNEAIECWAKVLELDENHQMATIYTGLAHFKKGDVDQAFTFFEKAIALNEELRYLADANEVRKAYDQKKREEEAIAAGKMWARQIVVKTRRIALDMIKRLDEGQEFVDLAKTFSIDTETQPHSGDLGFFFENEKSKLIVDNVKSLQVGEYSKTPIKSDQGYVIFMRLN